MLEMKSSGEHRRGRSMGSAPPQVTRSGEKDEDLALFHEMKRREKHNFLHPSPDDLDATLSSKFGGMGAPAKKPGTDLLTSESDKNDYDWLLTPPGTPLFPSLDQEAAALAVLSPALSNGSYSSASSATKSLKSSTYSPAESVKGARGNPSPRRQMSTGSTTPNGISRSRSSPSTAPILTRPSTPTSQAGTRPSTPTSKSSQSSVRSSTPNLKLTISHSSKSYSTATTPTGTRPSTPTPRSSTPPVRPSTPGGRSSTPTSKPSTPTMRRSLSGGRAGITSPSPTTTTRGGPSPKRTPSSSRGNSPSAKRITSVITSIAGMSSEAPPNLRTTMPERSTSASKANGSYSYSNGEEPTQSRRRPRSPSGARSFSSSSSQEQRTSSQTSRGSVISSYDDGLEVNRPPSMGSSRNSSAGKWHAAGHEELLSGKTGAFAKRVTRSSSIASRDTTGYGGTPSKKKTSDGLKRPVDAYQNSPTTAYRHLHSSSPVSPFYSTRTSSLLLRAGVAMNSSMTTSSNASSEHGTTIAADTEGSERDDDDLLSWDSYSRRASMSPRLQQADIMVLDKDDEKTLPWQDSLFERANSHGPSSSHSQGSQSTLDAEVTGFYETDGIASLEMLEQLGLMGESYQLKKSSSIKSRSSEKRAGSTEDFKLPNLRQEEYNHHSRVSPHKVYQESQGSPARLRARLEKQESSDQRPRKSRDFESKIPPHLVFQENLQTSPARHLANLEKQELPERPRKSRDFDSKSSPRRSGSLLEGQRSPARHLGHLEKQDSYGSPRRSREFESKNSPRKAALEGQGSPRRLGQGSPSRYLGHLGPLEKQVTPERARRSRDFETELLKRNGEKALGSLDQPQLHNSEIRAACLFVRDFKVGVTSPQSNLDSPLHLSPANGSPAIKRRGIEEIELKLRNELSYDWDNSADMFDRARADSNGDMDRKLSDSPILVPLSKKQEVGSPKLSSARLSLDFPFTPADVALYQTKRTDSPVTPEKKKHVNAIDIRQPPELTLFKGVDLDHSLSMNGTPTSAVIDNSFAPDDGSMDVSDAESPLPKEVEVASPVPPERSLPNERMQASLFTSQVLGVPSDLSDDGVYAMDEDMTEMQVPEDGVFTVSGTEAAVMDKCLGGVDLRLKHHSSPMEVDEASSVTTAAEYHRGGVQGGLHEKTSPAEVLHHEAAPDEELDMVQSSEDDGASGGRYKVQSSGEDNEQGGVVEEVMDGMWYSETENHQQDVVDSFLQAVPFSVETNGIAAEKKLFCGEDERNRELPVEEAGDGMHVSERQVEKNVALSNGNHDRTYVGALDSESASEHEMESDVADVSSDHGSLKRPGQALKFSPVHVEENLPLNLRVLSDLSSLKGREVSALHESYDPKTADRVEEDVLMSSDAVSVGVEDPVAELVDIKATQGIVKAASVSFNDHHEVQEASHSFEYFNADVVSAVDDIGDDASSNLSSSHVMQELHSPKHPKSVSLNDDLHYLPDAKEDVNFPQKDIPSLQFSEKLTPKEDIHLFQKISAFDVQSEESEHLPTYGSADGDKFGPNCKPSSVQFVDKHPEVVSEDISEVVQPPKPEYRSASTLCAALEEQIAGLIQKIDSAIEESSKPFNASPQESLLVKEKRSILEPEQDDCTGSMRSSQEEDLIDMLWAEDDETSCSEGSRDQDFLNGKDCSQREINGVRSSRMSDRGLPISPLGQSNDAYDTLVRSSRSDLGVEKRMLEFSSKRSALSPVDQQDDVVVVHVQNREPTKSPVKSSLKSPLRSPLKSPLMWSQEINPKHFGILDDAHFHLDAEPKMEKSSVEGGAQPGPDEVLRTASFGEEYVSDSLTESSSCCDGEYMKTDAELFSVSNDSEQGGESDTLTKSTAVLEPSKLEAGPVESYSSLSGESCVVDATSSVEKTQAAAVKSEATIAREVDMSSIMSNGDRVMLEARDQDAVQELAPKTVREESPIHPILASSKVGCNAAVGVPTDERLSRKSILPEETPSRPVSSIGHHVSEDTPMELDEEPRPSSQQPDVLLEMLEDSPSSSPAHQLVDQKPGKDETRGSSSFRVDHSLSDTGKACMQESGVEDIHLMRLSPEHEVSFGGRAVEEPESPSGRVIEEGSKVVLDSQSSSDVVMESTEHPDSNSPVCAAKSLNANADAEIKSAGLCAPGQEKQLGSPQEHRISPTKPQVSARGIVGRSHRYDERPAEGEPAVQEVKVVAQRSPGSSPGAVSNGSVEEVQTPRRSNQRQKESWTGQHISLISPNKMSIAGRQSFRMEEAASEPELAKVTVRENGNMEAHDVNEVVPQESIKGTAEAPATVGHQEVTRLSVWGDLPAVALQSPRKRAECTQTRANDEDVGVGANGNGDLGAREDKDSIVSRPSVKRLPSNKAKSVRTISLSPKSHTESPSEEPTSPEGDLGTPQKSNAYTNITVISPESLQWDHSSPAVETPTKAKSTPASLSKKTAPAEATDTILYCSSLMLAEVPKPAPVPTEKKEEPAALASTPTSNGEAPHLSEVVKREENDPQVDEAENCKPEELNTTDGPPSVRRALSYMGHETVPSKPADTSLQIPTDQVIEKVKAVPATLHTAIQVNQKEVVVPVKVNKAKCGCSIM